MEPLVEQPDAEAAATTPAHNLQLDLGLAVVALAYEHTLAPRITIQVEGGIFGTWFAPIVDGANFTGFGGGIRPSFFLTGDAPRGVYVAPFLRIDRVTVDKPGATKEWGYSTGAFAGYSWLFGQHVNARVGAGAQWFAYEVFVGQRREPFRSFFPALDLVVGYAL